VHNFIGDLSGKEKFLIDLDIRKKKRA